MGKLPDGTPYVAFGNDELASQPSVVEGDVVRCPSCGGEHQLEYGTDAAGKKTSTLAFYKCDAQPGSPAYLGALDGKLVTGLLKSRRK